MRRDRERVMPGPAAPSASVMPTTEASYPAPPPEVVPWVAPVPPPTGLELSMYRMEVFDTVPPTWAGKVLSEEGFHTPLMLSGAQGPWMLHGWFETGTALWQEHVGGWSIDDGVSPATMTELGRDSVSYGFKPASSPAMTTVQVAPDVALGFKWAGTTGYWWSYERVGQSIVMTEVLAEAGVIAAGGTNYLFRNVVLADGRVVQLRGRKTSTYVHEWHWREVTYAPGSVGLGGWTLLHSVTGARNQFPNVYPQLDVTPNGRFGLLVNEPDFYYRMLNVDLATMTVVGTFQITTETPTFPLEVGADGVHRGLSVETGRSHELDLQPDTPVWTWNRVDVGIPARALVGTDDLTGRAVVYRDGGMRWFAFNYYDTAASDYYAQRVPIHVFDVDPVTLTITQHRTILQYPNWQYDETGVQYPQPLMPTAIDFSRMRYWLADRSITDVVVYDFYNEGFDESYSNATHEHVGLIAFGNL